MERRLEIDNILRESEKNIKPHDDNYMTLEEFAVHINELKKKIFIEAVKEKDTDTVRFFLENGADVNSVITVDEEV